MLNKNSYSDTSRALIRGAFRLAAEQGFIHAGSGHILLSMSREGGAAAEALRTAGMEPDIIRDLIRKYEHTTGGFSTASQTVGLSIDAAHILELAEAQSQKLGHKQVDPEHILLGILQEKSCMAAKILMTAGAEPERIASGLLSRMNKDWPASRDGKKISGSDGKDGKGTKILDEYSRDLTAAASADELDPVIGRDEEVQRVIQILSRRTKNNPVLIGEPGVGKTAIAEGLARRVYAGDVPENLLNKRIVSLDLARMLSGAKFRGDFEERIKNSIDEAIAAGNVILFIDELHTLIGAGASEGAMDAANILKPALSRGEIRVIGATTLGEYRKHIEKDAALERRFQSVLVKEPSAEDAIAILNGLRSRYEEHHKLSITDDAIKAAVELSARYIQDRHLPDKAIDLVDEAASRVRTKSLTASPDQKITEARIKALGEEKNAAVQCQDFERAAMLRDQQNLLRKELEESRASSRRDGIGKVLPEDVAAVVSAWTGIPVTMLTEDESRRLLRLEETLHKRVVGQDEAVKAVAKAIRRGRVGLKDPKRPMGAFLFLGPTGVGKTELCKALAEAMFQDENAMLRVDMSEYMERHSVSRLIGSPPGYVGYDEAGQLTEKVRRKPYSVILFDEVEKAHEDVFNILLQIMEDGVLTDSQGRKVDFKNAIIVMTSNLGARNITERKKALGFSAVEGGDSATPQEEIRRQVMAELKKAFKPEFLNRLDDPVVFHQLDREHIRRIAEIWLKDLSQRMEKLGVRLETDEAALDALVEKGFDPVYGARPLRRLIQSAIEDEAAEKLLDCGLQDGCVIRVTAQDGEINLASLKLDTIHNLA